MRLLRFFMRDEGGATAVEYGLLISLIAVALFAGLGQYYEAMDALFGGVADTYDNATH
jgi:pilus assembly protein Flp/PilA